MEFFTSEIPVQKIHRKFGFEAGLGLYSSGCTVMRPADLYTYADMLQLREALTGCNIYLICRRKRISVCPNSLECTQGFIKGDFRVHDDSLFAFERFPFLQVNRFTRMGTTVHALNAIACSSGYETRVFDTVQQQTKVPTHVLIANSHHSLSSMTDLEVLYIGQAYGDDGSRIAVDRLSSHSTLQRIMAESCETNPSDELLLLMFRFEHAQIIASSAGDLTVTPSATSEQEYEHMQRVHKVTFDRKQRILLAEAALINYFKPKYNKMHTDSFSFEKKKRLDKLKTVKSLLAKDFSALIVEINTSNLGSKLFSQVAPTYKLQDIFSSEQFRRSFDTGFKEPKGPAANDKEDFVAGLTHVHIAKFPMYTASERETFLHELRFNTNAK
jgi:hypothetical protein